MVVLSITCELVFDPQLCKCSSWQDRVQRIRLPRQTYRMVSQVWWAIDLVKKNLESAGPVAPRSVRFQLARDLEEFWSIRV